MLRALIVLLVCMNLGVGAWWAFHREPPPPDLPATERGIASLELLSEAERRGQLEGVAELNVAPEPLSDFPLCQSLGPFTTPADLRRAMDRLTPLVGRIQFREVPTAALRGYRVYLPAAGNRAQALDTARALSLKGVTDYYVVTAGDQQNTISLGIFRDLANAQARRDELARIGYNAIVEARTEQVAQWWVDIAARADFDWKTVLPEPNLQAASAPCQ